MTPDEKDAAVRKVLNEYRDERPLTASEVWSCLQWCIPVRISDDSVRRSLKRIGAVWHPGGRYSAPDGRGICLACRGMCRGTHAVPAVDAERPKALPPYTCSGCHKIKTDYAGSRGRGDKRWCWACVVDGAFEAGA